MLQFANRKLSAYPLAVVAMLCLMMRVCEAQEKVWIEQNGQVVIEAESLDYHPHWELRTKPSDFTGRGYLTWIGPRAPGRGNDDYTGKRQHPDETHLILRVWISYPGVYRIDVRNYHQHKDGDNDAWIGELGRLPEVDWPIKRIGDQPVLDFVGAKTSSPEFASQSAKGLYLKKGTAIQVAIKAEGDIRGRFRGLALRYHGPHENKDLAWDDYVDRCTAIWNAQIVSVLIGWNFEHKQAAVRWVDGYEAGTRGLWKIKEAGNCAPVDDDWYYEMATLNAFESYGPHMTVKQLGDQWVENNVGVWGSSGQARLNILKGIAAPMSGHPRYNRLWFTMGAQNRCDLYGMLNPGQPNQAAAMARHLQHINSYAEGTDGGVFVSVMIALAFFEKDHQAVIKQAARVLNPQTPHRQCIDMVIHMGQAGFTAKETCNAVMDKWAIEYPATNNAVANMGLAVAALWYGEGDFMKSLNVGFAAADFCDADCNSTTATVVLAAMHGMKIIPRHLLEPLHNHMRGNAVGHVKLKPPVDMAITELGKRTAQMGLIILKAQGATLENGIIRIPSEQTVRAQEPELFHPNEFVKYWDRSWKLERAGYGAPGGGHRGIRGGTFLEDDGILATFPRDEVRGVKLSRTVKIPEGNSKLVIECAADAGRIWRLEVCVDHDRVLRKLVSGGPALDWPKVPDYYFPPPQDDYEACRKTRHYETVEVDLTKYAGRELVIRVYQHTLVRNGYPGNAYWKRMEIR